MCKWNATYAKTDATTKCKYAGKCNKGYNASTNEYKCKCNATFAITDATTKCKCEGKCNEDYTCKDQ